MSLQLNYLFSLILAAGALSAQQTWIVDMDNGPGTHFLDIPPAVAAASPGDTILVRESPQHAQYVFYTAPTIDKGLFVVGVGRPQLADPLTIAGVPRGERVVVMAVELDALSGLYVRRIDCLDNLGSIHFEDVKFGRAVSPIQFGDGILIARCSVVTFTRCELWGMGPPITLRDSNAFAVQTIFRQGGTTVGWIPADETLWCDQGADLTLVDCRVRGADGYVPPYQCSPTLWADSAIRMSGGTLRVSGDSEIAGGDASSALSLCTWIEPAIIGTGTVQLDPRVRVLQTNGVYTHPGRHRQAALTSGIAVAGSRIDLTLYSPPRATAWLFVSAPMPQPIPLPWGNVWLDPRPGAAAHLAAAGVVDLQGMWTRTLPIFPSAPHGRPIMFQAIVLPRGGGTFEISTPTVSIVR